MIRWEIRKIAELPQILFVAFLLCVQMGVLFYSCVKPNQQGYSAHDIYKASQEREQGSPEQQLQMFKDKEEALSEQLETAELTESELLEIFSDYQMYQQMIEEASQALEYDRYLEEIRNQASRLQGASLLVREDTFTSRNVAALEKAYSDLIPRALPWNPSGGIELLTDSKLSDFFLIFCMLLFSFKLTVSERIGGQYRLLHTAADGCRRTWVAKLAACLVAEACCILLFYLSAFATIGYWAGIGKFSDPIQSVHFFYQCPYKLTIGQFLILFVLIKTFALTALSTVIFCIGTRCKSMLAAIGCVCACLAGSLILWYAVERATWYELLKEVNLIAPVYTWHYFSNAVNLNVAGYPVPAVIVGFGYLILISFVSLLLSRRFWSEARQRTAAVPRMKIRRKVGKYSGLFLHEWNKLLIKNKGVGVVFVMVFVLTLVPSPEIFSRMQYYYQKYAVEFSGPLTEEKKQKLLDEEQRIAEMEKALEKLTQQLENQEISIETYQLKEAQIRVPIEQQLAFETVQKQYAYLEKKEAENNHVVFLDESGWKILYGEWGEKYRLINAVWIYILGVLLLHNYWIMERTSHMEMLIRSTPDGMKRVTKAKRLAIGISFLLLSPIPWSYRFVLVAREYALPGYGSLEISSSSISVLGGTAGWCPILIYHVLQFLAMEAETLLCMLLMLHVSRYMKSEVLSLCSMSLIAVMYFGAAVLTDMAPAATGRNSVVGNICIVCFAAAVGIFLTIKNIYGKSI